MGAWPHPTFGSGDIPFPDIDNERPQRKMARWEKSARRRRAFRLTRPPEPDADGFIPLTGALYRPRLPGPNPLAWAPRFQRREDPALGATVCQARRRLGWPQRYLAQEAGISHGYLADIELGKRSPATQTRCDLAWSLGLELKQVA